MELCLNADCSRRKEDTDVPEVACQGVESLLLLEKAYYCSGVIGSVYDDPSSVCCGKENK